MDHRLIEGLMEAVVPAVREYVTAEIIKARAPLLLRIETLEACGQPLQGPPGEPGKSVSVDDVRPLLKEMVEALPRPADGKSVTLDDVRPLIDEAIGALPKPVDGKSVSVDDVRPILKEMVEALPRPADGKSVTLDEVRPLIDEAVAALPKPADGKSVSVDDVRPLLKEMVAALPRAKDGVGVAGALINREGELVLTLSNGSTRQLGLVVGRDGEPGARGIAGKDGWSLEQFDTELMPDGRTLRLKFVSGDTVEIHDLCLGLMLYQGVWRPGSYERGDTVTLGGSLWHCNVPTSEKPDDGSKAWTLAAKRGRDGKDGKPGEKGMPGPAGNPGRDGRQW